MAISLRLATSSLRMAGGVLDTRRYSGDTALICKVASAPRRGWGRGTIASMTQRDELTDAVRRAATRAEVTGAVEQLYAQVQAAVDQRTPACELSGRCWRFGD